MPNISWATSTIPRACSRGPALNADNPAAAVGARRQLEARACHDTWDRLAEITADTLLIGGRYDLQAPPDNMRRLADRIPRSRLEFFDGGHLFLLQEPTSWEHVAEFLVD